MKRYLRVMRGMALGAVLMVIALATIIAFALAGLSISHLHLTARQVDAMAAQNLAESAVSDTIAEMIQGTPGPANTPFDYPGSIPNVTRTYLPSPGATGLVTFDPIRAAKEGMLMSINNHYNPTGKITEAQVPYGSVTECPKGDVLVSAKATVNGVVKYATALVSFPSYQYVMASSGAINSTGPLVVASTSATPNGNVAASVNQAWSCRTMGGNIASNGTPACNDSIQLGAHDTVMGEAKAVRWIKLNCCAVVQGGTHEYQPPVVLPTLKACCFNPATGGGALFKIPCCYSPTQVNASAPLAGPWTPCPLTVVTPGSCGTVTVNGSICFPPCGGGLVYVNGSLVVHGGVNGYGLLAVKCNACINGNGNLSSAMADAALVVCGNVNISGTGHCPSNAGFEGLVFTNGKLTASDITLVGNFVGGGPSSYMCLNNVRALAYAHDHCITIHLPAKTGHYCYGGGTSHFVIGTNYCVQIYKYKNKCGNTVYGSNVTKGCAPSCLSTLWKEIGDQICALGHGSNPDSFSASQMAWICKCNKKCWQNHWGTCGGHSMTGLANPVCVIQYLPCDGLPPGCKGSSQGVTISSCGKCLPPFNLNKFFNPENQTKVVLWEVI